MRPIPANITDAETKSKLEALAKEIALKMKEIEVLKTKMKSGQMAAPDLAKLKEVSVAIDTLDREWKSLI